MNFVLPCWYLAHEDEISRVLDQFSFNYFNNSIIISIFLCLQKSVFKKDRQLTSLCPLVQGGQKKRGHFALKNVITFLPYVYSSHIPTTFPAKPTKSKTINFSVSSRWRCLLGSASFPGFQPSQLVPDPNLIQISAVVSGKFQRWRPKHKQKK